MHSLAPASKARYFRHPLRTLIAAYDYYSAAFYDWRHGINTARIEPLATLELARPENLPHANPYEASGPAVIRSVFRNLDVDFRDYCFVDVGCGKGRVLVEAAARPFRSVIGLDFAKELCDAARANLEARRATRRCKDVQVLYMDATEFDPPHAPGILYFYNSFRDPVLSAVLARIYKSFSDFPRHLRIVSVAPLLHEKFMELPGITIYKRGRHYILYDLGAPR